MFRSFCVSALCIAFALQVSAEEKTSIGHIVFFQLKDASTESQQKLVAACDKYLKTHDGVVYYSAGVRGKEFDREVNAQDWDVALHLIFKDKASHDKYQTHEQHLKFIEENKENWKSVKVYDSHIKPAK